MKHGQKNIKLKYKFVFLHSVSTGTKDYIGNSSIFFIKDSFNGIIDNKECICSWLADSICNSYTVNNIITNFYVWDFRKFLLVSKSN